MDADLSRAVADLARTLFVEGCVLVLVALYFTRRA